MPAIMKTQVIHMLYEHVSAQFEEKQRRTAEIREQDLEIWESSEKRETQERLETHQVVEATAQIIEHTPEAELRMKLGSTSVKGLLADLGESIHLARLMGSMY